MLRHALILSSQREYAQTMRHELLQVDAAPVVDIETDPLRAMQLTAQPYDLVLIDAVFDVVDGLQLMHWIKGQAPAAKYVVVGEAGGGSGRNLVERSGADLFLERPLAAAAFHSAVESVLGLFRAGQDAGAHAVGIEPVDIAEKVRAHCVAGDSVLLLVRGRQQSGDIFIFRGEVCHAQYPGKTGAAAFRDIIRWDEGRAAVKSITLTQAPPRTIELSAHELLDQPMEEVVAPQAPLASSGIFPPAETVLPPATAREVEQEAPPREDAPRIFFPDAGLRPPGETALPPMNSHWNVSLSGELLEGSQVAEPDRCAFITTFIYRKLADVAVALEVDYFDQLTLLGPHLTQVLAADNLGVRHGVLDTMWSNEEARDQYVKWCREQSL